MYTVIYFRKQVWTFNRYFGSSSLSSWLLFSFWYKTIFPKSVLFCSTQTSWRLCQLGEMWAAFVWCKTLQHHTGCFQLSYDADLLQRLSSNPNPAVLLQLFPVIGRPPALLKSMVCLRTYLYNFGYVKVQVWAQKEREVTFIIVVYLYYVVDLLREGLQNRALWNTTHKKNGVNSGPEQTVC